MNFQSKIPVSDSYFTISCKTLQGKSTLTAAFFNTVDYPKTCTNLGEENAERINFYYALVNALKPFLKNADFELLVSYPSTRPQFPDLKKSKKILDKRVLCTIHYMIWKALSVNT